MAASTPKSAQDYVAGITASGLSIYDDINDRPELFVPIGVLEEILTRALVGLSLDYPMKTRSKVLKQMVCRALGYPVPSSFRKTRPRFPGQNFDTYGQKSNNLQIWNETVSASRRYVLVRPNENNVVSKVRVLKGDVVASYDTTGTLTQKFQAAAKTPVGASVLVSPTDTAHLLSRRPKVGVLPIDALFGKLDALTGHTFPNPGLDQERNRGAIVHQLVQKALGAGTYSDTGQFPDVASELLELKLQTSPTIDLGLVSPESTEPLDIQPAMRHCDVRYGVFYAELDGADVRITAVVVSTGEQFFSFFRKFGGLEVNRKLQIPLPASVFE